MPATPLTKPVKVVDVFPEYCITSSSIFKNPLDSKDAVESTVTVAAEVSEAKSVPSIKVT